MTEKNTALAQPHIQKLDKTDKKGQNIYLILEQLYHKRNPLIKIVVDGSSFLKILRKKLESKALDEDIIFARVLNDEITINTIELFLYR